MKTLFEMNEDELIAKLSDMQFAMIGHGHWAYVFGDTDHTVVIKVFPPLNVGTADELGFIRKNPLLRFADRVSLKWQSLPLVDFLRQKAKFVLAVFQSSRSHSRIPGKSDLCIRGYERCINKGLMERFPTRVIANCCAQLPLKANRVLIRYFEQPAKIVVQKHFQDHELFLNVIKGCAQRNEIEKCRSYIEKALEYQVSMWRMGLVSTDMSFNIFENLIVLPDDDLQLHDANDVVDEQSPALWFVREKEKDLAIILSKLHNGQYPDLLFSDDHSSVCETARKLYNVLSKQHRNEVVKHFLEISGRVLTESVFRENWKKMTTYEDQ